jgi:hypothetical protein
MNMLDYWDEPHYEQPLRKHIEQMNKPDAVNHPEHYGGADNTYEAIKVIEAWELGFNLGNVVKYISRAGKKGSKLEDLRKAQWYLNHEIKRLEGGCF